MVNVYAGLVGIVITLFAEVPGFTVFQLAVNTSKKGSALTSAIVRLQKDLIIQIGI